MHLLTHNTHKLTNGYIVKYTKGVYIIFVVYAKYMQSIQYHVYNIFCMHVKYVFDAAKYGIIFVDLKMK